MGAVAKRKIEERSIGVLETEVNKVDRLAHNFNKQDKEMCWDGSIEIYTGQGEFSKKNLEDNVPVQIKGHADKACKYIKKERIQVPVSIEDLQIYYRNRGVLYFNIYMSEDYTKGAIFYVSLLPSKIKGFIERAIAKKNKKTINIPFTRLKKDGAEIYYISKQFSMESKKQGFGDGQIVPHTIKTYDMNKVISIKGSAIGAKNESDFLDRLAKGDMCFYGKKDESGIEFPIEWDENSIWGMKRKIANTVSINGNEYYESYYGKNDTKGNKVIEFSNNISWDLVTNAVYFTPRTLFEEIAHDAQFMLDMEENGQFEVGNYTVNRKNTKKTKNFDKQLKYYVALNHVSKEIGLACNKPFTEIGAANRKALFELIAISKGESEAYDIKDVADRMYILDWVFDDKYYPILIFTENKSQKICLVSALNTQTGMCCIQDKETGKEHEIPNFFVLEPEVLSNLYQCKYDNFYKQIENCDINKFTVEAFNLGALKCLIVYDSVKKQGFLKLAQKLFEEIKDVDKNNYYLINYYQSIVRERKLTKSEEVILLSIIESVNDEVTIFASYVVLGLKNEATVKWKGLKPKKQTNLKQYPIYTLFEMMR